jgi:hypothetical protein
LEVGKHNLLNTTTIFGFTMTAYQTPKEKVKRNTEG